MKDRTLRIGELAARIGVQPETIRYYERRGLLSSPHRGSGGYRVYTPDHLERVEFIKACQTLGLTLEDIRKLMELKFGGSSPCQHVRDLLLEKIQQIGEQIERLESLRRDLRDSVSECERTLKQHSVAVENCPVLKRLEQEPAVRRTKRT
jgi:MerR family Zn(II)-responsive transcriptional regulator of zntA